MRTKTNKYSAKNHNMQCCSFLVQKYIIFKSHNKSVHFRIQHTCQECGKQFTTKTHLNTHNKSAHMGVKFPCTLCEYKATKKSHLKRHYDSIHLKARHSDKNCDFTNNHGKKLQKLQNPF